MLNFIRRLFGIGSVRVPESSLLIIQQALGVILRMEKRIMSQNEDLAASSRELLASNNQLLQQNSSLIDGVSAIRTALAAENEILNRIVATLPNQNDPETANLIRELRAARDTTNAAAQITASATSDLGDATASSTAAAAAAADATDGVNITGLSPTEVHRGDALTITGTGFGDGSEAVVVMFEGAANVTATPTSDTEITVTVPDGAQTGLVSVETVGGGVATSADPVTVLEDDQ